MTRKSRLSQNMSQQTEDWNPKKARDNMILLDQTAISMKNMMTAQHKSMFLYAMELRKVDPNNRHFSNGVTSDQLLEKLDLAIKLQPTDLPKEGYDDFHGDNKPGVSPSQIRKDG